MFQEATHPAVIERLAQRRGMTVWAALPRLSLGFMSRLPIARYEWHRPRVSRHAFLEIVPAGAELTRVRRPSERGDSRRGPSAAACFELRAMLNSIAPAQHGFHALVGDFNTVTPGELLDFAALPQKVRATVWLSGGTIRWRTIQVVKTPATSTVSRLHPADPGLTLPTSKPQVRLDYLFVPRRALERVACCEVVRSEAAAQASDHLPLLSELRV